MSLASITQNHLDPLLLFSKFSKFSLCKFGPDLPNLVKFISTPLKSSTNIQAASRCNERPLHQKPAQGKIPTYLEHSVKHLACTVLATFRKIQTFSVSFLRQIQSRVDSALWHVAHGPFPLDSTPHTHLAPSWRRWRPGPPVPACLVAAAAP